MKKSFFRAEWKVEGLNLKKITAGLVALLFLLNQGIPVSFAVSALEQQILNQAPAKSVDETQETETPKPSLEDAVQTSQDFMQDELSLVRLAEDDQTSENEEEKKEAPAAQENGTPQAAGTFEEALQYLQNAKNFAATVVKNLTVENLKSLASQAWESAIAVVKGVIVLFTSHQSDEIKTTGSFKDYLDQFADFFSHFHVGKADSAVEEHASLIDLQNAYTEEHVASLQNGKIVVETYSSTHGVDPNLYDAEYLINKIENAYDPEQQSLQEVQEWIAAQELDQESLTLLRSDPPTNLPGLPLLTNFASTSPVGSIAVSQSTASTFLMNYNVSNNGSFVGAIINWGSAPADLSAFTKISFEMRTDNSCSGSNCVKVEFVDSANHVAAIFVKSLNTTFKQIDIPKSTLLSANPSLDMSHIKQINFVTDSTIAASQPVGFLEIKSGGIGLDPDAANPATTFLPATSTGVRPVLTGFASNDGSSFDVNVLSSTFASYTINTYNATSFGGVFFGYDNTATGPVESINFNSVFPSGMVLSMDSPNGLTSVTLEVTDSTGKKESIVLAGIKNFGQKWKITASNFNEIDVTKIKTFAFVVSGRQVGKTLNMDWGNWFFTPSLTNDATNPALTTLPLTSTGARPVFTGFASSDFSSVESYVFAPAVEQLVFHTYNKTSFGGTFINYDNAATAGTIETINLNTAFPSGLVLGLDNGGTSLGSVILEVTDINGKKDRVTLSGITGTSKRWKILSNVFDEVDVTQISTLAIIAEGANNNKILNLNWGNVFFVPSVTEDPANPAITPVPATSTGVRPTLNAFASQDFSDAAVTLSSPTSASINLNTYNKTSFGGVFLGYDNNATAGTIETINLSTAFPSGIVLGLNNGGTPLTSAVFEVTDINGKRDRITLTGITGTTKRWKFTSAAFDEVDVTKIQSMVLLVEGVHVGQKLNLEWGNFAFVPSLASDPSNPSVTTLPLTSGGVRPELIGFASNDFSNSSVVLSSATTAAINLNTYNKTSFGGAFISYDNGATAGTIETIDLTSAFPSGIVLGLNNGGTALSSVVVEITDNTGKKDRVTLTGITGTTKQWKILTSAFDEVDVTKIQSIVLLAEGRHVAETLNVVWGNFNFVPSFNSDAANPAITTLPLTSTGTRPALNGFASQDFSDTTVNMLSATSASIALNTYNAASFGGAFINYDNGATAGTIETIDLSTVFPTGLVLGLNNGGTTLSKVVIEVTDNTGKRDRVTLTGITGTTKRWKIPTSAFDQVDITKIQSIVLLAEGRHVGETLNVDWGTFDFVPSLNPDAANPAITLVPATSTGGRPTLTGFATNDGSGATAEMFSPTFGRISISTFNKTSFGGAFLSYDNTSTAGTIETINLNTAFPSGIVFGLNNSGTSLTSAVFEVTDINGKTDRVVLKGITAATQRWKLLPSLFDQVDVTKIQSIAIFVEGVNVGQKLDIDWGNFAFVASLPPDAANPAVTTLPVTSTGLRPTLTGFATNDGSGSTVTLASQTFATIDLKLFNKTSFGGAFVSYDNAATAGTIETINLSTLFPSGLVLGLDNGGTGLTSVVLEVTDINGKTDRVTLSGILATGQRWKILASQFDEVDVTKIQSIALFAEGVNVNKKINVDWGNFAFVPPIPADATNPAVTTLPLTSTGLRPAFTGFATNDGSASNVVLASQTFGTINLNLYNKTSFGGAFVNYDNAATAGTVETINLSALFPSGLVLGLDNGGTGLTSVVLEVTDINGKTDRVTLTGILATGQRYKVLASQFDEVDVTKIKSIALFAEGVNVGKKLNVDWGNFAFVPPIPADATNPAVTTLPLNSTGARPAFSGFATNDGSASTVTMASQTFGTIDLKLFNQTSFGGAFVGYDNPNTAGTVETINLSTLFPTGLVLGLDNGGTGLTTAVLEVTDINGKTDRVTLTGILATGQRWKVLASQFDEVDVTKIKTIALFAEGVNVNKKLNVDWGNFAFVPPIPADAANPAITFVPALSTGDRPSFTPFATNDGSGVTANLASPTFATLDINLFNAGSFGGAFLNYDNANTAGTVETINLSTLFPSGLVLGLDNGGTGLTSVVLEVTDINGKTDRVTLSGILATGQRWKVLASQFDEVDVTKIQSVALFAEGVNIGKKLNVDWGNFAFVPSAAPTSGLGTSDVTPLPALSTGARPALTGFASSDFSDASVLMSSKVQGSINMNLYNAFSFGGAFVNYDNPSTSGTVETINLDTQFPSGMVFGLLRTGNISEAFVEVTDVNNKTDKIRLTGIVGAGQFWKILPSQFDEVDRSKIKSIALVVEGVHVGASLGFYWGDFEFVPSLASDNTNPAVTAVPLTSTGERPVFTGFATADSSSSATTTSVTTAQVNVTTVDAQSFGGAFLSYDNTATAGTVETIDLSALFPTGLVLGLNNGGTALSSLVFEVTDNTGKKDRVTLTGITDTEKRWRILPSAFDQVDVTKIQSIALFVEGVHSAERFNVNWGNFFFVPSINSDATNPAVTTLPLTSTGDETVLTGFASNDSSDLTVKMLSPTQASFTMNLYNQTSFGGAFVNYDNNATAGTVETINLNTLYPGGLVLGLDNGGTGLTSVVLEVTDNTGKRDRVILNGITNTEKRWKISASAFDQVDVTKIQTLTLLIEGVNVGKKLNVNWGTFQFVPVVDGTTFNSAALTTLTNSPNLIAGGGNGVVGQPAGVAEVEQIDGSEFDFSYDVTPSTSSFSFLTVSKGGFNSSGTFVGTPGSLPQQFVLALRGRENGKIRVEITDVNGKKAVFILNLRPVYQNYTLDLSGNNIEAGFDRTQIGEIVFVADRNIGGNLANDLVKVKLPGLNYASAIYPAELQQVSDKIEAGALDYFTVGKGIDPVTHFPYDSVNAAGTVDTNEKFTQPTLIGFYLQILGDVVNGAYSNGMTKDQAITEMNTVFTSLLDAQTNFGWKGLLPWLDLDPAAAAMTTTIGLGDNANLAQSIAVAIGALESASLTPAQQTAVNALKVKAEQFLDNQQVGYEAFVDPTLGIFRQAFIRDTLSSTTGNFDNYMDRLGNEFRGAIAFLKVRYPSLPATVWTGLEANFSTYTDVNGVGIKNIAYYDGSAFQAFWPSLRNNERDFIGFRNALDNAFVTYADYSAQNHLPGFTSAAQRPNGVVGGVYFGRIGIRDLAESGTIPSFGTEILQDVASTYALANAYAVDPIAVLTWLNSIEDQLGALSGTNGFFDSARSNSEIARNFLGIDIASSVLSLANTGGDAFDVYLRNRNLELSYNLLYDQASQAMRLYKTSENAPAAPELADRSKAVFSHISSEGVIGSFPSAATTVTGATYQFGALAGGFGGKFWVLDQDYNATANQLIISYSAVDTPKDISIELKDGGDNLLYQGTVSLVNTATDKKIVIQLPNTANLATVRKVLLIVNQNATGDTSADFRINYIDFQHLPSSQTLTPSASLGSGDVSTLSGNPPAQLFSSNPASSLDRVSASVTRLNYNVSNPGDFAGFSINFDPTNSGATADLSALPHLVFGIDSAKVDVIRMEVEDNTGKRAVFFIKNIDVTRKYYDFLTSLLVGSIDRTKVKKINFVVDQSSVAAGEEVGNFQLELSGIQ